MKIKEKILSTNLIAQLSSLLFIVIIGPAVIVLLFIRQGNL